MQSSEPIEHSQVNDHRQPALADESWRAEVAARVKSYRSHGRRNGDAENAPTLDFGPAMNASGPEGRSRRPQNNPSPVIQRSEGPRTPERAVFDTNYYRQRNAESMAQIPVIEGAVAPAAISTEELEGQFEFVSANSDAGLPGAEQFDSVANPPCDEADDSTVLDLEIRPVEAADTVLDRYCISAEAEPAQPVPPSAPQDAAPAQGNLLVFRRPSLEPPLLPQPSRDELAEPINNRPRILEVPEDIMPAVQGSLFPEIRLDVDEQESSNREPKIEVPLPVAAVSARVMAALTDMGVVLAAGLLFAAMAWRALPDIPHTKPFWMGMGAVTLVFWTVYQHLFLLYAGRTLGMSMRGIRLSTFDGRVPAWKQRARRARSMLVSFAPVTLGFLWALVDEDTLCWHDRISQTFPTSE